MNHSTQAYDRWILALQSQSLSAEQVLRARLSFSPQSQSLSNRLEHLDRLKAMLDLFRPLNGEIVAELKQRYDVRFTYHSNAIEGNTLSLRETALVLERGITIAGKSLKEHLEVIGHEQAINYIESFAKADAVIDEWELRQIHSLILRQIDPEMAGRFRRLDVKAAGTEYVYPPHYQVQALMISFVQWLNSQEALSLHPIVYASEAHLRLVTIHPFQDGNGRLARLLMNLLLIRSGFPITVITNQQRSDYIDAIVQAQADRGTEALFILVANAAQEALIESLSVVATAASSRGQGQGFFEQIIHYF
ncbi:Fic family protein [Phormidesmis priestleyi ULC007]|uniref:Fic family protein n=1 Tax=Phormidesmis priestleyi ULC007 TaxID=1920490 RepID=A0A2T1D3D4_9CYAN|nr:Fic family protein [Phormidesmis priestleyi]PSB15022.1 Fic family protein [Phormidesmis priestleyi ULC007]PSB15025.1 Fic family protein [Phormidesmis priestleyi ULC007]